MLVKNEHHYTHFLTIVPVQQLDSRVIDCHKDNICIKFNLILGQLLVQRLDLVENSGCKIQEEKNVDGKLLPSRKIVYSHTLLNIKLTLSSESTKAPYVDSSLRVVDNLYVFIIGLGSIFLEIRVQPHRKAVVTLALLLIRWNRGLVRGVQVLLIRNRKHKILQINSKLE